MSAPDLVIRGPLWRNKQVDLLVHRGKVLDLLPYDENRSYPDSKQHDGFGVMLLPSLIDGHVHLREPGFEYKETIASGLTAAAHGGFGHVLAMANTMPVNDNAEVTELMLSKARSAYRHGPHIHPVGALTRSLQGQTLSPMAELSESGCVAFSNDGIPVISTAMFRHAVEYAHNFGIPVIDHCEDPTLSPDSVMNESRLSGILGLRGQPTITEALHVSRDILISGYLNIPIHLAHISCKESVDLIRYAKEQGIPVTAETCPHYLFFTEDAVQGYNTAAKVNPPLRTQDHCTALMEALHDGTIDILTTDHAPHADFEKEVPFCEAPFGISGLDTALSLCFQAVSDKTLDFDVFLRAWSTKPGELYGIPVNSFNKGDPADFILFDHESAWKVTPDSMYSKGKNTPCMGITLPGRVTAHFLGGRRVV